MKRASTLIRFMAMVLLALPLLLSAQDKKVVKKVIIIKGDSVVSTVNSNNISETTIMYTVDIDTEDFEEAMSQLAVKLEEIGEDLDIKINSTDADRISFDIESEGSSIIIRHDVDGESDVFKLSLDSILQTVDNSVESMKQAKMEEISNNSEIHQLEVIHAGMAFAVVKAANASGKELKISVLDEDSNIVIRKSIIENDDVIAETIKLKNLKNGTYFVVVKMEQESVRYKLHIK